MDADWAIDPVREFAFNLLRSERIPFTYFATADQNITAEPFFEIAWHPNLDDRPEKSFESLSSLFPFARGVRPHRAGGMVPNSLLAHMHRFNLLWTSVGGSLNQITPQYLNKSRINFPISWGDNYLFTSNIEPDWSLMLSPSPGYYILNFHPIHLYLNTESVQRYQEAKKVYSSFSELTKMVNVNLNGIRNLFLKILKLKQLQTVCFLTVSEAYHELVP